MAHPETLTVSERPKGVYFFAENPLIQQFLDREGDPYGILEELERTTIEDMAQVCHFLKTSILLCRGVEKIYGGETEEEIREAEDLAIIENDRRMYFYSAADAKLGNLASQESE